MRGLNRVLTLLVSVAVIAAAVVLAVEVVVAVFGSHPLMLDWRAAYRAGRTDAWDSTVVRVIAGAVALVGLLLLVVELKPRRVRRLKVNSADANTDAAVTRAGVRSALRRAALDVDGISSAKVKLGRRTAKVSASSRAGQAGLAQDLNTEVGAAVTDRLASLQLRCAPRARTSVQTRKVRS